MTSVKHFFLSKIQVFYYYGSYFSKVIMEKREKFPLCILLFSGKRKSGKDYFTDKLLEKFDSGKFVIIKISAPIKARFAKNLNLDLNELMSSGEYKETFRKEMIDWSDEMRIKDPGIFCRTAIDMYDSYSKPIWVVSDVRRKTDINWFKETFGDIVKTVRIEANNDVRKSRGWEFKTGVDDVASECDLDDYEFWDWKLENNNDDKKLVESISNIFQYLNSI